MKNITFYIQDVVQAEVKVLLALKADYKNITGTEWKPGQSPVAAPATSAGSDAVAAPVDSQHAVELYSKVAAQGETVRQMKTDKAEKVSTVCVSMRWRPN